MNHVNKIFRVAVDMIMNGSYFPLELDMIMNGSYFPLELIHSSRDALRKAREAYLIERGQTLEPKGVNKREEI